EFEKHAEQPLGEGDDSFALLWVAVPLCAMIVATGALYLGKPVLLPLAIALILSVVFSPVATRLEHYFGRLVGAALVVLLVLGVVSAAGYFLTIELTTVADQVAEYSDTIGNKLAALEKIRLRGSSMSKKPSPTFSVVSKASILLPANRAL